MHKVNNTKKIIHSLSIYERNKEIIISDGRTLVWHGLYILGVFSNTVVRDTRHSWEGIYTKGSKC